MQLRKLSPKLAMIVLAVLLAMGLGSPAYAAKIQLKGQGFLGSNSTEDVTIAYVNWTEAIAVSHLLQAVLENNFKVNVKLKLVTPPQAFKLVADGKADAFLDVWLPTTHAKYWAKYKDDVVDLGVWYQGVATLGIAVPNYVQAQSIADLKKHVKAFHGKIIGIQPGSGEMRIVRNKVMPAYGLKNYKLVPGSTARLIKKIDHAIHNRKAIAFTAWKPHWLFHAYPIRYLKDPKHTLAQADHLHAIVRKGLKKDSPVAYAVLNAFHLTKKQLGNLELTIANSRSAWGGVRRWLAKHQKVVAPWIVAGKPSRTDYL